MTPHRHRLPFKRPPITAAVVQRGAALLAIIVLVVIGLIAFLLAGVLNQHRPQQRVQEAQQRMGEARDALLAFAATEWCADPDGFATPQAALPCWADGGSDGAALTACNRAANGTGRLPWRTLTTRPLRDEAGECLWYTRLADLPSEPPPQQVVARLHAPGPALAGQDRLGAETGECGSNPGEANYLEPPGPLPGNDIVLDIPYSALAPLSTRCPASPPGGNTTGCGAGNPPECSAAGQALASQVAGNNNGCRQLPGIQISAFCQAQLAIINGSGCSPACVQAAETFTTPPCISSVNPPQCQAVINALNEP